MSITLIPSECQLYYKLHFSLLYFIENKYKILQKTEIHSYKEFQVLTTSEEKMKVRKQLYKNITLIDEFMQQNPDKLSKDELEIVARWKQFIQEQFYIIQYQKEYAVFLPTEQPEKAYGVKALQDEFEDVIPYDLPILVDAVLLPFKEHIIYDGMLLTSSIIFGSGIRRDLQQAYQEAKTRFGLITSLPESTQGKKQINEELLKFYLKNQANRDYFADEIWAILDKKPALLTVYHQEMGKSYARSFVKNFHEIGINKAWFATLQGIIVASGTSKKEVEDVVQKIIPQKRLQHVYFFLVK